MLFCGDFFVECLASVLVVDNVEKLQKYDTFKKKIKNGWHGWKVSFREEHVDLETSMESDESLLNDVSICGSHL